MAKRVDIKKAAKMRSNGCSFQEIADVQGVSRQAVQQALAELMPNEYTKAFQNHRADILSNLQLKLLKQIDDDRLKKTPVGSLVLAACQLYDKERLERGQSTSNQAIIHADIQSLKAMSQSKTGIEDEVIDIDSDD